MDEPLEEVALVRSRRPPGFLELLVRLEVAPGADQREAVLESREHGATEMV